MPGLIPSGQVSPKFTGLIHKRFDELQDIKVNDYWSSQFPTEICKDRFPIIEVRRGTEKVAIDIPLGGTGTRTQMTKFDQKAYDPFNFDLWFDATEYECYWYAFGSSQFSVNAGAQLINGLAVHQDEHVKMIQRARELMAVSIFETGKLTSLRDGSIIDYKRQANSFPVNATLGTPLWTDEGSDPFADLKADCDYLRQVGKASGYYVKATFGTDVWAAFRKNSTVKERWKEFNNQRDVLPPSQKEKTGEVYQGMIDCDSYKLMCYTYNEFYDDPASTASVPLPQKSYKDPKTVILTAENFKGTTLCGAVPQISRVGDDTDRLIAAEYVYADYRNEEYMYHRFHVKSRPIPVPITVDRIVTRKPIN